MRARSHHYVPQWLQRRFLRKSTTFFYLDLTPDRVRLPSGGSYIRRDLLRWGTERCFAADDLYTISSFGGEASDVLETEFFGEIDRSGSDALPYVAEGKLASDMKTYKALLEFFSVLKIRTPKGLDWLKKLGERGYNLALGTKEALLSFLMEIRKIHITTWAECTWEVVSSEAAGVSFLLTDHPVTAYNPRIFPGSPRCRYPFDPPIELLGTRTLVPLDSSHCLILSNQEYVRRPDVKRSLRLRTNARAFGFSWFQPLNIAHGRELTEKEVLQTNFILKRRARRYLAAEDRESLYPERALKSLKWDTFDASLLPRGMVLTEEIWAKFEDGTEIATDAFGRPITDESRWKEMRNFEQQIAEK